MTVMDILATVSPIETILAFIVYVGSFVAIPILAKAFAGALNRLTGLVGDKTKGIFDRPRRRAEKWAEGQRDKKALRKATRQSIRGQHRKSLPGPLDQISPRRFLSGGSLRHSRVGQKKRRKTGLGQRLQGRIDDRRAIADTTFAAGEEETFGKFVDQEKRDIGGRGFGDYLAIARNGSEALHRRQAAIVTLAKAGAVGQLRELVNHATATPAENDKNLHIALNNAVKSGAFYEESVTKKAPDLAAVQFETKDKLTGRLRIQTEAPSAEVRLKTVGDVAVKDSTDLDISTWRASFGLKPIKAEGRPDRIVLDENNALQQAMLAKIKVLMEPGNKVGQAAMTKQQKAFFEEVLKKAGKELPSDDVHPNTYM